MTVPERMTALVQRGEGYAGPEEGGALSRTLEAPARFLSLAEIPVPKPGPGQVLIRVSHASVNPSDIAFVQGFYGQPRVKGAPAGFEGVGEVVAGNGFYARQLVGARVAFAVVPGGSGAWAEYAVTAASAAIPLMREVRDEDGAALIVNPLTAAALVDMVRPGGGFIATAAASQLGKLMAGLARQTSRRMIAVVRRQEAIATLQDLGATIALDETHADFHDYLGGEIRRVRPIHLFDAVAGGPTPQAIFRAMGKRARWVIYGQLDATPPQIEMPGQLIFMDKRIEGFWLVGWMNRTPLLKKLITVRQVQKRFIEGVWHTDIGAVLPLSDVLSRLSAELSRPDHKVLIAMEKR
ncbi:MAG: NADH oxidoreductase [Alphaproteobacteria bacterium]|nr:MAG: NADH oxidoreductase [Alphaproteobacteria bacterium]